MLRSPMSSAASRLASRPSKGSPTCEGWPMTRKVGRSLPTVLVAGIVRGNVVGVDSAEVLQAVLFAQAQEKLDSLQHPGGFVFFVGRGKQDDGEFQTVLSRESCQSAHHSDIHGVAALHVGRAAP